MKKLSVEEQKKVIGGYDNRMCGRVQQFANTIIEAQRMDPSMDSDWAWDLWADAFNKYCL